MAKTVAIIGAGCSGLAAIKCCLEDGLEPTCFEKSDDIGGLWRYTEMVEDGRASLYSSVVTNISKEMMCYTDFPMPEDFPAYLHNSKVLEYLRLYAEHFRLLKYIKFKTEVCVVTRSPDYSKTGQWEVITKKSGVKEKECFDSVLVCNGHHVDPYLPLGSFPGIDKFKGCYIHSRFYKKYEDYCGKTVLIVGIGNSAGDIAVEISGIAKQVYVSTRKGTWVLSRIYHDGLPIDMALTTRCGFWISSSLPAGLLHKLHQKQMNSWFDHANYGLQPEDTSFLKEPMVNDHFPSQILCGAIRIKPHIRKFTESSVVFEDGSIVDGLDEVIFATGYSISFPFLDDSIVRVNDNNVTLYKNVFPPHHEKPTLAFIGLVQPLGSLLPVSELQVRWATRIFKGAAWLPPVAKMEAHFKKSLELRRKRFGKGKNQALQTYFIEYMDEVAMEIGIRPNIMRLLITDPKLGLMVFFGPCTPYQYRLTGPGKWSGAKNAILTQWSRTLNPARTRVVQKSTDSRPMVRCLFLLCGLTTAIFIGFYCVKFKTLRLQA
ncbi:dimethylaniline monooxygenase [N-oxide-forming] 2-like isoform X2 [Bufo gargarizans]|nr:dimethylaniline monooxygenase [N-oxide-forming] 2-like isoform X2 [Bufo gargarizans]XP_044157708.1 dimethylaniline monooxygenase [N-oxide-forming] 2-like isoform X2 [Bufo gargarizans]